MVFQGGHDRLHPVLPNLFCNIWPLTTKKNCPIASNLSQNRLNILIKLNRLSRISHYTQNWIHSGGAMANAVTALKRTRGWKKWDTSWGRRERRFDADCTDAWLKVTFWRASSMQTTCQREDDFHLKGCVEFCLRKIKWIGNNSIYCILCSKLRRSEWPL